MIRLSKPMLKTWMIVCFATSILAVGTNGVNFTSAALAGSVSGGSKKETSDARRSGSTRYTVRKSVFDGNSGRSSNSRSLKRNERGSIRYSNPVRNLKRTTNRNNRTVNSNNRISNSFNRTTRTTNIRNTTRVNVRDSYNTYNRTTINVDSERSAVRLRNLGRNMTGGARSENKISARLQHKYSSKRNRNSNGMRAVAGATVVVAPNHRTSNVHFGDTIIYNNNNVSGGGMREISGAGGGTSANDCRYGTYCTINLGGPKIITFNDVPEYDDGLEDENLTEAQMKRKYGDK